MSSFYSSKKSTRSGASPRRPLYSHSRGWKPSSPYRRRSEKKLSPFVYWKQEQMQPGPYLVARKKKCFYNVRFPYRPLGIQMASSERGTDAYIIHVDKACGVPDAQELITINSKVIYINGHLVEGCEFTEISSCIRSATLPIRVTLVRPENLHNNEIPQEQPEIKEIL